MQAAVGSSQKPLADEFVQVFADQFIDSMTCIVLKGVTVDSFDSA